jgi:imidazolonepropionase-like amidohydrolase
VYLAGHSWQGNEPDWKGKDVKAAAEQIVEKSKADGYEYIKTYYQLTPEQFDALGEAARRHGLVAIGHVPRTVTLDRALGQLWSIEHLTGFDDALEDPARHVKGPGSAMLTLRRFAAADESKIVPLAKGVAKSGVWQVPTLFTYDIWTHPDQMRDLAAEPEIRDLEGPAEITRWTSPNPWYVTLPEKQSDADKAAIARAVEVRSKVLKALYDAGARIAVGTDASEVYMVPGISLHQEMRLYEKAGIPSAAILKMATVNGAEISRHSNDFGTISVGKRADLLLLAANPLRDLATLNRPDTVIAAGRVYTRDTLEKMVADVVARRKAEKPAG